MTKFFSILNPVLVASEMAECLLKINPSKKIRGIGLYIFIDLVNCLVPKKGSCVWRMILGKIKSQRQVVFCLADCSWLVYFLTARGLTHRWQLCFGYHWNADCCQSNTLCTLHIKVKILLTKLHCEALLHTWQVYFYLKTCCLKFSK